MKTKHDIIYGRFIVPIGTEVIPATNLPEKGMFWAEPWQNMSEEAESWSRNYGFLLTKEDIS